MAREMKIRKAERTSPDMQAELVAKLKPIIPEAFAEGKIDWERLKRALGGQIDSSGEKFTFTWAGKSNAVKNVLVPGKATLRPDKKESVNFEKTENVFIEGDNLEVLKLLQKAYFEKVKMIYIDPPYNTGNDFVYRDDFKAPLKNYLEQSGQVDSAGNRLSTNTQASGRFHSDWLTMMYPRLKMAWNLLRHDGVIFVSIDDKEVHNLRMLMNEVFGEENFIDSIIWKKRYGGGAKEKYLISMHEYLLFYAKNKEMLDPLFIPQDLEAIEKYYKLRDEKYETQGPYRTHPLEAGKAVGERKNLVFPIIAPDKTKIWPKRQWYWSNERVQEAIKNNELEFIKGKDGWTVHTKQYLKDKNGEIRSQKAFSIIDDVYTQHGTNEIIDLFGNIQIFPYPKPTGLIRYLLKFATASEENDIILDFFAGSGTTSHAVLAQNQEDGGNRKFILVQMPEPTDPKSEAHKAGFKTIADIAKERIRRVIKKLSEEDKGKSDLFAKDKSKCDLGFKIFKLGQSNYPDNLFEYNPEKTDEENAKAFRRYLEDFNYKHQQGDYFADKDNNPDIIYENIIKEGLNLNAGIIEVKIGRNRVYKVADGERELLISLDGKLQKETVAALKGREYKEKIFICFDFALDDSAKANLALNVSLKTI